MGIPNEIKIIEEKKNDVTILRIQGRLDAVVSPGMQKRVFEIINKGNHKIVFDFTGVEYLSSAGMRMLLLTSKTLLPLSGRLVICSVLPNVQDVLKMSGFDILLTITKDENDALQKF